MIDIDTTTDIKNQIGTLCRSILTTIETKEPTISDDYNFSEDVWMLTTTLDAFFRILNGVGSTNYVEMTKDPLRDFDRLRDAYTVDRVFNENRAKKYFGNGLVLILKYGWSFDGLMFWDKKGKSHLKFSV